MVRRQCTTPTRPNRSTPPPPQKTNLQGPEIRTGMLEDGKPVQLTAGQVRAALPTKPHPCALPLP